MYREKLKVIEVPGVRHCAELTPLALESAPSLSPGDEAELQRLAPSLHLDDNRRQAVHSLYTSAH